MDRARSEDGDLSEYMGVRRGERRDRLRHDLNQVGVPPHRRRSSLSLEPHRACTSIGSSGLSARHRGANDFPGLSGRHSGADQMRWADTTP